MSAKLFHLAAELVDKSWDSETGYSRASCLAIQDAAERDFGWLSETLAYQKLFLPEQTREYELWGKDWGTPEEVRDCRILALLFAAAMAETGDL